MSEVERGTYQILDWSMAQGRFKDGCIECAVTSIVQFPNKFQILYLSTSCREIFGLGSEEA
jgi:hypothetical protein